MKSLRLPSLVLIAALLSYRGGLHSWQLLAAALLLLGAWAAGAAPALSRAERGAAIGAILWCGLGLFFAWDPQAHLNSWALLGGVTGAFLLARQEPAWTPEMAQRLLLVLGAALSALFLLLGALNAGGSAGHGLGGLMLAPHISARWLAPNQNILAGAWSVPALFVAFAWALDGRRWAWAAVAICSLALVYAGSRGALLGLMAGLSFFGLRVGRRPKVWMALAALGLVLAGLVRYAPISRLAERQRAELSGPIKDRDPQIVRRKEFWARSFQASLQAPWLGRGLGGFATVAQQFDLPVPLTELQPIARYRLDLEHAHNEWLNLAVEQGWPFTLALAAGLLLLAYRRFREGPVDAGAAALEAGLCAALAISLVDMNLRSPGVLALGALVAGALFPAGSQERRPQRWLWLLPIFGILAAGGLWAARGAQVSPQRAAWAAVLQPLDAGVQAARARQGAPVWPWAAWSGRHHSPWLWQQSDEAGRAGRFEQAISLAEAAAAARPYFAPGQLWLGQRYQAVGRLERAKAQVDRALELEPNFSQALAWQCERALARGDKKTARELLTRIQAIQKLKVQREEPDSYTLFIQSIDSAWLEKRNKDLGLSTVSTH